jgi:hypothetical protein
MLEFAEAVLRDIRDLKKSSEEIILGGGVSDMERYRFLMGRLEGLKLVEESVKKTLKDWTQENL